MSAPAPTHRPRRGLLALRLLLSLAWRNIWRNPVRSVLTIGAMAVGVVLMVALLALVEGLGRQMQSYATDLELGHVQVHRRQFIDARDLYAVVPWEMLEHLREATAGLSFAPRLYAAALGSSGDYSTGVMLKAIVPEAERRVTRLHAHLRRGAFRLGPARRQVVNEATGAAVPVYPVVVGHQLARNLHVDLGGELVLITQAADGSIGNGLFRVAGILRPIGPAFDRTGVLMSREAYRRLMVMERGAHEIAVRAADVTAVQPAQARVRESAEAWLSRHDPGYGGKVVVRRWQQINPTLAQLLEIQGGFLTIIAVIIFAIAALGMVNTMLMAVHERTQEFGILLAMGMGRLWLLGMVLVEAVLLALAAGVAGGAGGALWAWYLQVHGWDFSSYLPEGLDWAGVVIEPVYRAYLLPEHVAYSVALMLLIALAGVFIPSAHAVRLQPAAVLHG